MHDRAKEAEFYAPRAAIKLHGRRAALYLYLPWRSPGRYKRELGFMIRVRDPRAPCDHQAGASWAQHTETGEYLAICRRCARPLPTANGKVVHPRPHERARWLWVKVFVAKTRAGRRTARSRNAWRGGAHRHGVLLAEVEAHWADERGSYRFGSKTFARFKGGIGGRYV
jgi:hypothetical protein